VVTPVLHFLGHSTVRVELAGRTVLTDPVLASRIGALRRVVPLPDPAAWAGVDIVLISHLHADHLHLPSLRQLGPDVRIVVPRGAGSWLRRRGFRHVTELGAGEATCASPASAPSTAATAGDRGRRTARTPTRSGT
jgi:L-ascorbate metabolism protein UlaG (beta-lactamase superfamily)